VTALLVDTSSLFFRAFHALPPMNTKSGEPTSAIYGFSVLLLKLLREERPTSMAFARDAPLRTFRHQVYDAYKSGRPPMPDALRPQWRRLDQLIAALAVPAHCVPGFEADDVLATLAKRLFDAGESAVVVSGDRDLFQVARGRVRVIFVGARGQKPESIDEAAVRARYGVAPRELPMLFGLIGEAADNIEGVRGVGAKTAAKVVARYGTMSALLTALPEVAPQKLREALAGAADRLAMNEDLARLRDDVGLGAPLTAAVSNDALDAVAALFEELEFKSLLARVAALRT
jgi:DNA polymerase-1